MIPLDRRYLAFPVILIYEDLQLKIIDKLQHVVVVEIGESTDATLSNQTKISKFLYLKLRMIIHYSVKFENVMIRNFYFY